MLNPKRGPRTRAAVGWCGLLAATFLASCPLRAQEQINGVVAGRVINGRGQPQRVLIHLTAPGEILVAEMYTGSNGEFAFTGLRSGIYYITVEAEGFQPARATVSLDAGSSSRTQVEISLEPASSKTAPPGPIIAGSPKSYALNVKENSRPFNAKAVREFQKGNQEQQAGNFPSAIRHYQKALKSEPNFYPALNNLGAIFLRRKDFAQAESVFLKSLEANPEDSEAYINMGHVFYSEAKYPQAVERLEEGIRRSPSSSVGHFFLGSAYLKSGDIAKAEENLKAACRLDPERMASAHLQLANLYLNRGNLNSASAQLQDYLRSNPSDPQSPAIKKMLDSIAAKRTN